MRRDFFVSKKQLEATSQSHYDGDSKIEVWVNVPSAFNPYISEVA